MMNVDTCILMSAKTHDVFTLEPGIVSRQMATPQQPNIALLDIPSLNTCAGYLRSDTLPHPHERRTPALACFGGSGYSSPPWIASPLWRVRGKPDTGNKPREGEPRQQPLQRL